MLMYPQINPVALQLGPVAIHWYGLTYLAAFALFYFLGTRRLRHEPYRSLVGQGAWQRKDIEDILFLGVMGVIVGGRLGYCLFYKPEFYLANPLQILYVWQGGMSFHGGLLGVIGAMLWFARSRARPFWQVMDFVSPCVPTGLAAGRVGNFINGELWGKPTDLPWGFLYKGEVLHPTQLYEAALEGVVLFAVIWWFTSKPRPRLAPSGLFLALYAVFRIAVEFVRVPDDDIGYLAFGWLTMGQILSLPVLLAGLAMLGWAYTRRQPSGNYA
jgi:phosphatidylglycerol:prolipoprotein diacylglycerol transferase